MRRAIKAARWIPQSHGRHTRPPVGKRLKHNALSAFKRERDRIDALLKDDDEPQKVASAN